MTTRQEKLKFAVIGHPIAHSQSPNLYRAAFDELGLDWSYQKLDIEPGGVAPFIDSLDETWRGISVTMPHKREVIPCLAKLSEEAVRLGVVNCVLLKHGEHMAGHRGFNTDVFGIVQAIAAVGRKSAESVLVLGGGATATSSLLAAKEIGASSVRMLMREVEQAHFFQTFGEEIGLEVRVEVLESTIRVGEDVVISALPPRVADAFTLIGDLKNKVLLDVAYDPWPTKVAQRWSAQGGDFTSGLHMLLYQALLQVRIFVHGSEVTPLDREQAVLSRMMSAVGLVE